MLQGEHQEVSYFLRFSAASSRIAALYRPEQSIARLELQRTQLPPTGFGIFHTIHLMGVMHAGCVTGRYAWAKRFMDSDWPRYLRSPLRRLVVLGAPARVYRIRLLLAQYSAEKKKPS